MQEVTKPKRQPTRKSRGAPRSKPPIITGPPTFSFHKQYVEDISDIIKGESDRKKQMERVLKKYSGDRKRLAGWTMQTFPRFKVGYILPPINKGEGKKPSITLRLVRSIVLGTFNNFLYLQEAENAKIRKRH